MAKLLPDVKVTTIVWADKDILKHSQWEAAQGDDLKNQRSTIELNLPKLEQRGKPDNIAIGMVESWLSIYIVFATRQDLINKDVRGDVSSDAERIVCKANFKAIMESPALKRGYADLAMDEILNGRWYVDEQYESLSREMKATLSTWREFSGKLDTFIGKCYLCGKELLSPEATPIEQLNFAIKTPHANIKPSPFLNEIVNICSNCLPLAREMGLDAKPLEIKLKKVEKGA